MSNGQVRRERAASGSKRQRDLDAASGFRKSRKPWPIGKVLDSHSASYHASEDDKERARAAAFELRDDPSSGLVFNAVLLLIAEGKEPLPVPVRDEAKAIGEATEAFFAQQRERRSA